MLSNSKKNMLLDIIYEERAKNKKLTAYIKHLEAENEKLKEKVEEVKYANNSLLGYLHPTTSEIDVKEAQ